MIELLATIASRLRANAYPSEAAVREGIIVPVLRELGWDTFDPNQVQPEFSVTDGGRIDYALKGRSGRPEIIIEAKAVGRALEADKQLFGYCLEVGVPIAVLTDGRGWNFYLPGGIGLRDERRVYSLQLDERSPEEARDVLVRYLDRERVLDRSAARAAREDHERALDQREALARLPQAWSELLGEANETLLQLVQDSRAQLAIPFVDPDGQSNERSIKLEFAALLGLQLFILVASAMELFRVLSGAF